MSWEVVEMRSFLSERKGRYKPDDKAISGLQRIDKIDFSGNIFLSEKPSKTDMILIKQGDLVISGINVEKGAMSIYKGEDDVIATIHYSSYEYNTDKIDIDFLRHFLKSPEFIEALKEQVPGGIKTEIKPKHILPLNVCIPTNVEEQREVVAFLDQQNKTLETQSTELTHQLDLVKQLRQAFLREAMQGKLTSEWRASHPELVEGSHSAANLLAKIKAEKERLIKAKKIKKQKPLPPITKEEIPFDIPKNWEWCRLNDIKDYFKAFSYGVLKPGISDKSGIRLVKSGDVGDFNINENIQAYITKELSEEYKRTLIEGGEILINLVGASIGRVGIAPKTLSGANVSRAVGVLKMNPLIDTNYSMFALHNSIKNLIDNGLLDGSNRPVLNIGTMSSFCIAIPPLPEQQRIVAKLDELMQNCDELEASIKESQQQNELLLQQVLREALEPATK